MDQLASLHDSNSRFIFFNRKIKVAIKTKVQCHLFLSKEFSLSGGQNLEAQEWIINILSRKLNKIFLDKEVAALQDIRQQFCNILL